MYVNCCIGLTVHVLLLIGGILDTCTADTMVCTSIADACYNTRPSDQNTQDRIQALEEKVAELQTLLQQNNLSDVLNINALPRDCEELYNNGTRVDGVYSISPDGRCPFFVYCDMTNGGWTLIQRRDDEEVSFARSWEEYVEGFGSLGGSHWLGLNKIHRLTKEGSQIYFDMNLWSGAKEFAHYKAFIVHEATTSYRMNVDVFGYNGSISERLSYHDGQKFSTFDRDNDAHSTSCSESLGGGGWWYNNCYRLGNVNGIYGSMGSGGLTFYDGQYNPIQTMNIKVKALKGTC